MACGVACGSSAALSSCGSLVGSESVVGVEFLSYVPDWASISSEDLRELECGCHKDPFSILGIHSLGVGGLVSGETYAYELYPGTSPRGIKEGTGLEGTSEYYVCRGWVKDAKTLSLSTLGFPSDWKLRVPQNSFGSDGKSLKMHYGGIYLHQLVFKVYTTKEINISSIICEYKIEYDGKEGIYSEYDTYSFSTLLPDFDLNLFQSGSCWNVDNLMGSHIKTINGIEGVQFSVWAPNALCVSVVGDWNNWDNRVHPMRHRHKWGIFELFIGKNLLLQKYGYSIKPINGDSFIKIDPYAQMFENPPATASIISPYDDAYRPEAEKFKWTDHKWLETRKKLGENDEIRRLPMSIYEVHLPSWMRQENGDYLTYHEISDRLVTHVKNLNFTHVEFLPVAQHPFEGSWGYQVSGLYAPYSRLGTADDFKYLINALHEAEIGVFIDFVPAHFVADTWALAKYDGQPCYEYADPREGVHHEWGTLVFNYRRNEVRTFLLGAVYHWLRRYHVDGLRIDAVSSMLYRNHMRTEWIPNEEGGDANLEAISLLKEMNWVIRKEFPGVFTMAEESTSWKGVTDQKDGLGFDAKWDLGWMNDTLSYLYTPLHIRKEKHSKLTFRGLYAAHEKWILPLSHDEVVNGKGSLLDKCGYKNAPFNDRLRTLRTLFAFQVTLPGRPLIFMGAEIAQGREWKENRSVDWHEGREPLRAGTCKFISDLLKVYKENPSLYKGDDESWNFKWTDCDNANDQILAYIRSYDQWFNDILVVLNFSNQEYSHYPIGVPHGNKWTVLLNSDDWKYQGSMKGPGTGCTLEPTQGGRLGWPYCLWLDLPAFGAILIKAPQK